MSSLASLTRRLARLQAATSAQYAPINRVILYDMATGEPRPGQAALTETPGYLKLIWLPEKGTLRNDHSKLD